jgi:WD40 repeat protein
MQHSLSNYHIGSSLAGRLVRCAMVVLQAKPVKVILFLAIAAAAWQGSVPRDMAAPTILQHEAWVFATAFSPDGKTLATGCGLEGKGGEVTLWDVPTGQKRAIFRGHTGTVHSIAYSTDGKVLATGSYDRTVKLWDVSTGIEQATLPSSVWIGRVALAADGTTLAWSSLTNVTVRDLAASQERFSLHAPAGDDCRAIAFSPDGGLLATGGCGSVKLRCARTGKIVHDFDRSATDVTAVAFSPDSNKLVVATMSGTLQLLDSRNREPVALLRGHTGPVLSVAYAPDGKSIASGSYDRTVRLWNPATGDERATLIGHTESIFGLAYSPDGKLLASASFDKTVRLWSLPE